MTGCTIRWLISELEKCENKDRPVKIMMGSDKAREIDDAGTILDISGRYEKEKPLRIYTWAY